MSHIPKPDAYDIRISMSFYKYQLFILGFLNLCIIKHLAHSQNHTLIFSKDNNIRNCSCSADIQSCDYSLANLMCNCKTIAFPKNKTGSRLSYNGDLTIWFSDTTTLGKLVNFTFVHNLKLLLCGATTLPTEYLAVLGLRYLRVQTETLQEQSLTITHCSVKDRLCQVPTFHISYLDTSLFNGLPLLKSYSVENVSSIKEQFPNLPFSSWISDTNKSYIVTLIY
ncbi:exosomal polycystin-1-interacting protein isoform 1-T2 [Leptodactylus fuscus]|uniref:exosomal polycystin-1-interacting protein n=1 Tax=Leptodactylus fuscus TaxID=238119 RepID=UPI003F4F2581